MCTSTSGSGKIILEVYGNYWTSSTLRVPPRVLGTVRLGNRCPFAHRLGGLAIKNSSSLSEMAAVKGEVTCATVRSVYKTSNYMQGMTCRPIAREDTQEHEGRGANSSTGASRWPVALRLCRNSVRCRAVLTWPYMRSLNKMLYLMSNDNLNLPDKSSSDTKPRELST